jgi:hypothetical protein
MGEKGNYAAGTYLHVLFGSDNPVYSDSCLTKKIVSQHFDMDNENAEFDADAQIRPKKCSKVPTKKLSLKPTVHAPIS